MKEAILYVTMWIVTTCTYIAYLPQIIKLAKTKKSEDLSMSSWILYLICGIANVIYSFVLQRPELRVAALSELIMIAVTLCLTVKYNFCLWNIQDDYNCAGIGLRCYCRCRNTEEIYPKEYNKGMKCRSCGKKIVLGRNNTPFTKAELNSLKHWGLIQENENTKGE